MKAPTEGTSTVEKASGGAAVVEELQGTVDSAESERAEAAEQKRREADEARELREAERQERAQARDEAARRAAAGEPLEAAPRTTRRPDGEGNPAIPTGEATSEPMTSREEPVATRRRTLMDALTDIFAPDQRQRHEDFARRYEHGSPWSDFDDQEALSEYQEVAPRLSEAEYRDSAREAFERLTPEQRREFGRWLRTKARKQGATVPDLDRDGIDDRLEDPGYLADATTQLRTQQPGFLDGLLGSVLGGGAGASGGTPRWAGQGGLSGLLSSPIARAAIGGIAAMAFSRLMRR